MALSAPTSLAAFSEATGANTITSATVTPTANGLILVHGSCTGSTPGTQNTTTISTTLSGVGTWSSLQIASGTTSGSCRTVLFWAQANGSPGSGTVTLTWSTGSPARSYIHVGEITGQDTTTAVGATGSAGGVASTLSITISASPAESSCVLGVVSSRNESLPITSGTGFTELYEDVTVGTAPSIGAEHEYDLTPAGTTVDWSALSTAGNSGCAIEVLAAAAATKAPPAVPPVRRYLHNLVR